MEFEGSLFNMAFSRFYKTFHALIILYQLRLHFLNISLLFIEKLLPPLLLIDVGLLRIMHELKDQINNESVGFPVVLSYCSDLIYHFCLSNDFLFLVTIRIIIRRKAILTIFCLRSHQRRVICLAHRIFLSWHVVLYLLITVFHLFFDVHPTESILIFWRFQGRTMF